MNPKLLGTVTTPKVLIYVDDGTIDIRHTRGVEVAVIVEGEDVEVPDDWTGLIGRQHHSLPITINRAELPQKRALQCPETQLAGTKTPEHDEEGLLSDEEIKELNEQEEATKQNITEFFRPDLMKAPYCHDCDSNHLSNIGCDGLPKTCSCCGASYGQLHSTGCADQNPLVEGGNIVR